MYKKDRIALNRIKSEGAFYLEADIAHERTLKQLAATRKANQLFNLGTKWFKAGKSLDEVLNNPKLFNLNVQKEITHFVRGYQEGLISYGISFGYNGTRIEDLPSEYATNRYFLDGYRKGLIDYQKNEERRNKGR